MTFDIQREARRLVILLAEFPADDEAWIHRWFETGNLELAPESDRTDIKRYLVHAESALLSASESGASVVRAILRKEYTRRKIRIHQAAQREIENLLSWIEKVSP